MTDVASTTHVFDTLAGRKVPLEPIAPGRVGIYACGVTVYDMAHIGHARVYVVFDVVRRFLEAEGFRVTYVRNFTDVDDKIIKRAQALGVDSRVVSEKYITEYLQDMDSLGVRRATVEPKVTEHISEIVALIERLIAGGRAYASGGDVFYAVAAFPAYMKLSKRSLKEMMVGARVDVNEAKRDPLDFVLWKAAKPGEPSWPSPWGEGRPGWHIECSAMSMKYLGETFDIHGGGADLVFPHHENEIAQSEGATGREFARIWCHVGFVNVDAEKMSKSLGNFFTVRDVLKEHHPESVRYFLLTTHYRSPVSYSLQSLDEAAKRVAYGYETLVRSETALRGASRDAPFEQPGSFMRGTNVQSALRDDFNTAAALGHLADTMRAANDLCDKRGAGWQGRLATLYGEIRGAAKILGVFEADPESFLARWRERHLARVGLGAAHVAQLIEERLAARTSKDYARADAIRGELAAKGIALSDAASGTTWRVEG